MLTITVEDSKGTMEDEMEDTGEMDMLDITITMDSIDQILNPRRISAKCFVSSAITKAIMPQNALRREWTLIPSPILSTRDM